MTRNDNELLRTLSADFGLDGFVGTVARTHNIRLKEILKRRALFGKQTVVLLIGSCGETNSGAFRSKLSVGAFNSLLFKTSLIPSSLCVTNGSSANLKLSEF